MAFPIHAHYTPAKTVAVTLQQQQQGGSLALWWDNVAEEWTAVEPAEADKRITLAEADSDGVYVGGRATALGSYTGLVLARFWDLSIANPIASFVFSLLSGNISDVDGQVAQLHAWWDSGGERTISLENAEAGGAPVAISANLVDESRKWIVSGDSDAAEAENVVSLVAGSECTVAADFSRALNPRTSIASVNSVVASPSTITTSSHVPSQDRMEAHFDVSDLVAGEYEITISVTTTDSQTFGAVCCLRVR